MKIEYSLQDLKAEIEDEKAKGAFCTIKRELKV